MSQLSAHEARSAAPSGLAKPQGPETVDGPIRGIVPNLVTLPSDDNHTEHHPTNLKICCLEPVLAPYSIPRFRALQSLGRGYTVQVMALGATERSREWQVQKTHLGFEYLEAFRGETVENIQPRALASRVSYWLDDSDPQVVVITGYYYPAMRAAAQWAQQRGWVSVFMRASGDRAESRRRGRSAPACRMFKKAPVLTRPAPARQDAPLRRRARSVACGLLRVTHHISRVTSSKRAARTKLGAKRVSTRWGRVGVKGDFFNVLLEFVDGDGS